MFGVFIGGFALCIIGVLVWVILLITRAPYKYIIRVNDMTQGQAGVHLYLAKKLIHPQLGEVLEASKRKQVTGSKYFPYFGNVYEYTTRGFKGAQYFVPMTYLNGTYAPEQFQPTSKVLVKNIVMENGKPVMVEREVEQFVSRPLNMSTRMWHLNNDTNVKEDYMKTQDFWSKYGAMAVSALMIIAAVGLALFALIYSGEYQKTLLSQATVVSEQTANRVVQMLNEGNTTPLNPPPTGSAGIPVIGGLIPQ